MSCLASPELPLGHVKSLALHIARGSGRRGGLLVLGVLADSPSLVT